MMKMKHLNIKEKYVLNIMILGLIFMNILFAKEGTLVPYKSPSLKLTLMPDNSIRFIDPKVYKGKMNDSMLTIDTKSYKLYIGGDKTICKVEEDSPVVSTCVDKVRYIDWKVIGEDGQFKFMTDNNLCLTAGALDKKTNGYFVYATRCNQNIPNQKFKFTQFSKDESSNESQEPEDKKDKVQRMKSKADPDLKIEPSTGDEKNFENKNDSAKMDIAEFQKEIVTSDKEKLVLITVIDKEHPSKANQYKTNSNEMKRFLAGNSSKFMNHDFIVDSGLNANFMKA